MDDLAAAIMGVSKDLGVSPVDLGTAISYETAGTFDPWKAGPTTQTGQHLGLIQWGAPERQQYGVHQGMPVAEQMAAVERYLRDRGVQPGMGLMDIYSAINAGRVGLYNRSDAANGGAPGTVADKVNYQMGPHRQRAEALLAGTGAPDVPAPAAPPAQVPLTVAQFVAPSSTPAPQAPAPLLQAVSAGPAPAPQPAVNAAPLSRLADLFSGMGQAGPAPGADEAARQARRRALLSAPDPFTKAVMA